MTYYLNASQLAQFCSAHGLPDHNRALESVAQLAGEAIARKLNVSIESRAETWGDSGLCVGFGPSIETQALPEDLQGYDDAEAWGDSEDSPAAKAMPLITAPAGTNTAATLQHYKNLIKAMMDNTSPAFILLALDNACEIKRDEVERDEGADVAQPWHEAGYAARKLADKASVFALGSGGCHIFQGWSV